MAGCCRVCIPGAKVPGLLFRGFLFSGFEVGTIELQILKLSLPDSPELYPKNTFCNNVHYGISILLDRVDFLGSFINRTNREGLVSSFPRIDRIKPDFW